MAILKYKGADGQFIAVNSYKINNVIVQQETGESTADVMSQKAVTDELNEIQNILGDVVTGDEFGELQNIVTLKANKTDIPTKTSQLTNDSGFLTSHQSLTNYATKTEVTTADNAIIKTINDNETAVTNALNKIKQSAGFNAGGDYVSSDYSSLADAIDDIVSRLAEVENSDIIDGGEY